MSLYEKNQVMKLLPHDLQDTKLSLATTCSVKRKLSYTSLKTNSKNILGAVWIQWFN